VELSVIDPMTAGTALVGVTLFVGAGKWMAMDARKAADVATARVEELEASHQQFRGAVLERLSAVEAKVETGASQLGELKAIVEDIRKGIVEIGKSVAVLVSRQGGGRES
jgi:prefoldin subunit 5